MSVHGRFVNHHKWSTGLAPSKMETVLTRLHDAGLKVNTAKSLFCAYEIEYLGYTLTREGIKPQPKKVQAILALSLPNNVKELRHFLGMVQYYQDMWAKRTEMLAPLTDLVGECRETKTTRINKTKKKPWQCNPIHQQAFALGLLAPSQRYNTIEGEEVCRL
jgi:hypothetical protein